MTFSLNMETPRFRGEGNNWGRAGMKNVRWTRNGWEINSVKESIKRTPYSALIFFFSNFLHLSNFTKLVKYIAYLDLLSGVVLFESLRFFLISLEEKREYSLDWKTLYLYLHCTTCCLHSIWGSSSWFFRLSCKSIAISFELCLI